MFRDVNGDVHAIDAFCPHLGTNMAIAGKVRGTCLECPFHAWRFNGPDGKCTHIPGAKKSTYANQSYINVRKVYE